MRLIVACKKCHRQYDATGRKIGGRFRCYCGEPVVVTKPVGHDAAVVRCSACGAPREEGSIACKYCGSDFTLHERDMQTVCPECLARVSDKAKFCHHCGTAITPEVTVGGATEFCCPSCTQGERKLHNRTLGAWAVNVLECPICAGMWLGTEVFENLANKVQRQAAGGVESALGPKPFKKGVRKPWAYRKCIVCQKFMQRRNFAGASGIILDICHEHGIWFDNTELEQLVDWIREGGTVRPSPLLLPTPTHSDPAAASRTGGGFQAGDDSGIFGDSVAGTIFTVIIEIAMSFFRFRHL